VPRPAGGRNAGYDGKRRELLDRLAERLAMSDGRVASLRELAAHAGVTIPTLKHYFGSRSTIVETVLFELGRNGARFAAAAATTDERFDESIVSLLRYIVIGFEKGRLGALHSIGLSEGLRDGVLGPAYLSSIFEPTLTAVEARLSLHAARGELVADDMRFAALSLVAPLLLAFLHQKDLGGSAVRHMDIDAFIVSHAARFVRAHRC
jgi:AcrR family transcriptional regulator